MSVYRRRRDRILETLKPTSLSHAEENSGQSLSQTRWEAAPPTPQAVRHAEAEVDAIVSTISYEFADLPKASSNPNVG